MKKVYLSFSLCLFFTISCFAQTANWPNWRGPNVDGIASTGTPPLEWNETKNVKWKVPLPGYGHSTPVIWGDYLYVTTAIGTDAKPASSTGGSGGSGAPQGSRQGGPPPNAGQGTPPQGGEQGRPPQGGGQGRPSASATPAKAVEPMDFVVMAYNRHDGTVKWRTVVANGAPKGGIHADGSFSSSSPVTDGNNLYAFFGSQGLYCLDLDGNVKWSRNLGEMTTKMGFGEAHSPALHNGKVIIQFDHEGQSTLYVLDANTGADVWKKDRAESTGWSTPIVTDIDGKTQIIALGPSTIKGYDFNTGDVIWETKWKVGSNVISTPSVKDGILYAMTNAALYGIKLSGAKGDISDSEAFLFTITGSTGDVHSLIANNDKVYYLRANTGNLYCVDAKTGTPYYERQALADMGVVYSSPVATSDLLYFVGGTGNGYAVKQGENFEVVGKSSLDDKFQASPIIVGNNLYLKGFEYLYCIAE